LRAHARRTRDINRKRWEEDAQKRSIKSRFDVKLFKIFWVFEEKIKKFFDKKWAILRTPGGTGWGFKKKLKNFLKK